MLRLLPLLFLPALLCAQPKQVSPPQQVSQGPFPIVSITAKGNKQLSVAQVVAASGLKVGQSATPKQMEDALQQMLSIGFFDQVAYRYTPEGSGYNLEWDIQEVAVFYPVVFEDMPLPDAELKKQLLAADPLFGPQLPGTEEVIRRFTDHLNRLLTPKDEDSTIRGKMAANDKNELHILFRPRRGLPTIYTVDFQGSKLIPPEELRPPISSSAVGLIYREEDFRKVLDLRIRPLYEARGRLRVQFPEIKVEPAKGVNGLNVMVSVVDGEEYNLGTATLTGIPGQEEALIQTGNFRYDAPANMREVEEGRKRIESAIRRQGYLDATVVEKRKIDDKRKVIDLTLEATPGPIYNFDTLFIKGLDILSEPTIRKMWSLKTGFPYNPEYPESFLNRIKEEGILDNLGDTRSEVKIDKDRHIAIVTLFFKGAPPPEKKKPQGGFGIPPVI
jgi:outer membrane protein insertion porin family